MFSGNDNALIANTLDQLSNDEELRSISTGGLLRELEEHGTHYGLLILVFDRGQPLQIR